MNRNWSDFKSIHGNIDGARSAFEEACETLFRKIYVDKHVSQVSVKKGDGGIDIFVGEFGVEPITVIQCKFFLDTFDEAQFAQIRNSFTTAQESKKYELKEWILCIPRVIDIDENSWWFKWKHKKLNELSKNDNFIQLKNGNYLIYLLKEHNLYNQVFKIEDSLKIDEIHRVLVSNKPEIKPRNHANIVLFNNYHKKCKSYYLEREQDLEFMRLIEFNHIWIFGESGVGKTALVNRNLIENEIEFCFCDLSPIKIESAENVLEEIINCIEEKFEIERSVSCGNLIKEIVKLLKCAGQGRIVIVIDELSINSKDLLKEISQNLVKLVTYYNNSSENEILKFVVSTIFDPKKMVEHKAKASSYFQYINCEGWEQQNNISKLFDTLNISLNLEISEHKNFIISNSRNSPRILKNIFRKIIASADQRLISIERAVKFTLEECV